MQGIIDHCNYGAEESFDFQTNVYPHEVSQDVVSTFDAGSLQGIQQAEPFFTQQNSFLTVPDITFQQPENEYLSIQNYPTTTYGIPETQFYEPGQSVVNNNSWYDGPKNQDAPHNILTAPASANFSGSEDPNANKQSTDQITVPTVIKSSTRSVQCFNCKVTRTPLWRRTPDREHLLCNACGLYYKQTGRDRSTSRNRQQRAKMIRQQSDSPEKEPLRCVNCNRMETPLWRKNNRGETICNACGLYARIHNKDRPVKMHKAETQRRRPSSYFEFDDNSKTAIAVTKALSSGGFNDDPEYISQIKNMGTKDAIEGALEITKNRYEFLRVVLSYMENNNHPQEEQCN